MPPAADFLGDWQVSSDQRSWLPARVPGTAAGAVGDMTRDYDADDWWFRARLDTADPADDEELRLRFEGIATLAEVRLDGEHVLDSASMFASHELDLGRRAHSGSEVLVVCRALEPVLAEPRRPRARWRPRLAPGGLRFVRTMIMGRAPGFAPGPAAVGPWRPVTIVRRRLAAIDAVRLRTRIVDDDGRLEFSAAVRAIGPRTVRSARVVLTGPNGTFESPLERGHLDVPRVARWWPHTHGEPALHHVRIVVETDGGAVEFDAGRVGFRTLTAGPDVDIGGIHLRVNDVPVFARGAVWTPLDPVNLAPDDAHLHHVLSRVCASGMNMLRVPGTSAYESERFHDLCDELGVLVWQDFMFANFDYPVTDDAFRTTVEAEAGAVLARLASRPSLAVVCGNSEVEQQATMLGRTVAEARGELFGELLPRLVADASVDAPYVPSAPCGGDLPFRPDVGIANYYGVGGYRRPLTDVRTAGVRFAAECLAFSNLPDDDALATTGIPGDVGADWDFADVRVHYAVELYGEEAARRLEVGRAATGEAMAEVFGEWRRAGSGCGGGLVLWLTDVRPGAGWGVLDHTGAPKAAYHHLRRALAPIAVWMTDRGQSGLDVHVANDGPTPLSARLRVAFYREGELKVDEVATPVELPPHTVLGRGIEAMLGRFVDASYAFRFGPPAFDVVVASLERDGELLAQDFRFPAGRPTSVASASDLGFTTAAQRVADGTVLTMSCRRLVHGARVVIPDCDVSDNAFSIEPGSTRTITVRPINGTYPTAGWATAVNLAAPVALDLGPRS